MKPVRRFGALALAAFVAVASADRAAGQIPPDEDYRTFRTPHFQVIFPERLEEFARHAAASAEWAHGALSRSFIEPPGGRIGLVITDHTDSPNASATPIPRNRVTLIATPDIAARQLNYYTDWLDLTLAHELTHVFHLDRAEGLFWKVPRALFGRVPLFFPAFYQPQWVIEGLATYYESRLTGAGRAYGSFFDMLLTGAALGGELRGIDAANGIVPRWPAGNPPYAYGGLYFRWLAEEHGDSAIASFTRRAAARFPYTVEWAATPAFGQSLSSGWRSWQKGLRAHVEARADSMAGARATPPRPLSDFSWAIPSPRFSPDGRLVVYTLIDPRADPSTVVVEAETGRVVRRQRRNGAGSNAWSVDGKRVYLQQPDFRGRYRIFTDLYTLDTATGAEERLTHGARVGQPDPAPDGSDLVAVQTGGGTNRLVLIDPETGALAPLTQFVDSVNWQRPRFSPDGRFVAAARWVRGGTVDIVLLHRDGSLARWITRDDATDVVPAWSPDGNFLLWSSDRHGLPDVYAADLSEHMATDGELPNVYRVTRTPGGAMDPDVSPDGRWLAYVAHHADGFRVEIVPFDPSAWQPAEPGGRRLQPTPYGERRQLRIPENEAPTRAYSPLPSLVPTSWLPLVTDGGSAGTFIGATTAGTDYVNRHTLALLAGWVTEVEDVEAALAYFYTGLGQPTLRFTASQEWLAFLAQTESGQRFTVEQRDREFDLAATFLFPGFRNAFTVTPSLGVDWSHLSSLDPAVTITDPTFTDLEARLLIGFSRARSYARSVSREKGFAALLDLEHERMADDLDRWRVSAELELVGYQSFRLFGYANHVLAARLAAGVSDGRRRAAAQFNLGGIPGRSVTVISGVDIGGGADYPVRGFDEGVQRGDRVAAASLEYRFPLALVGRGHGLWPVLLDRLSGSFFMDVGSAWSDTDAVKALASAGAELSVDLGVAYAISYRFRLGLARQLVAPTGVAEDWDLYLTAGIAF